MTIKPKKCIPATIAMPLSTVYATAGALLTRNGAGSLTNTVTLSSSTPAYWVCAADADNSSGVAKSTTEVLVYPMNERTSWECVCSGTPISTTIGICAPPKTNTTIGEETNADGGFLIEEITDATNKKVLARWIYRSIKDVDQ